MRRRGSLWGRQGPYGMVGVLVREAGSLCGGGGPCGEAGSLCGGGGPCGEARFLVGEGGVLVAVVGEVGSSFILSKSL